MALRFNIRLSGANGQGLLQAARILAEAAAIYDDKNAAESCAYGPEARGSAAKVDIIISDVDIDYPKIESVDCLIALSQEAFDRYVGDLASAGTVISEASIETGGSRANLTIYAAPFGEIAERTCGRRDMVHLVALGFFAAVNTVINEQSIRQAVLARAPKSCEILYMQAYEAGLDAARKGTP
jgi:2-oxoglutarate ferredoxin oxidoreductase subunit gamma